jgi:hypothetical protein
VEVPTRNIWREDSTEEMDRKNDEKQERQISGGFIIDVDTGMQHKFYLIYLELIGYQMFHIIDAPEDSNLSGEDQSRLILERAKKDLEDDFWQPFHVPAGKDNNLKGL